MDCSLPGFSIHGIFQAGILEWVAISFSIRSHKDSYNYSTLPFVTIREPQKIGKGMNMAVF